MAGTLRWVRVSARGWKSIQLGLGGLTLPSSAVACCPLRVDWRYERGLGSVKPPLFYSREGGPGEET
jgi:hypothetical protein